MLKHAPLFQGSSTKKQIVEIIKVLGTPTFKELLVMAPAYNKDFPSYKAPPLETHFLDDTDDKAIALVQKILQFSPSQRPTAIQILQDPYFDQLKLFDTKLPNGNALPSGLMVFTREELDVDPPAIIKLIP